MIKILIEPIVILIVLIISSFNCEPSLFDQDLGLWLILIGGGWFIATWCTILLSSLKHSLISACLAIIIAFIGVSITSWSPSVPPTADEMGNHPQAEWSIRLSYEKYGLSKMQHYSFIGPSEEANIAVDVVRERWNEENPNNKALSVHKILTYIPKEHAEQHHYPKTYTKRY